MRHPRLRPIVALLLPALATLGGCAPRGTPMLGADGTPAFDMIIENGRITEPLRDANLIGNGPNILSAIDAIGNDFATGVGTCGKDGQGVPVSDGNPTLRVQGITVGGTAG